MFANNTRLLVALGEVVLIALSVTIAWLLRFDFTLPDPQVLLAAMPILVLLRVLSMARFNLFHGYWRYTGIKATLWIFSRQRRWARSGFLVAERWILGEKRFPLSVYCIELILTVCMLVGVRVLSRAMLQNAGSSSDRDQSKDHSCHRSRLRRRHAAAGTAPQRLHPAGARRRRSTQRGSRAPRSSGRRNRQGVLLLCCPYLPAP